MDEDAAPHSIEDMQNETGTLSQLIWLDETHWLFLPGPTILDCVGPGLFLGVVVTL